MKEGENVTCTFTNTENPSPTRGKLTVIKHVINDNGGTRVAADWDLAVNGTPAGLHGQGVEAPGVSYYLSPGASYSVSENGPSGYASSFSADCAGSIAAGQAKTCTVTNDDQAAHLIIIKNVVNDNGGTKRANDFSGTITGVAASDGGEWTGAASPGVDKTLTSVGSYAVTEHPAPGYTTSYSADCTGTIALGQTRTCTVTNDDQQATLIVNKVVVNHWGGTKLAADFGFQVNGGSMIAFVQNGPGTQGQKTLKVNGGVYNVTEPATTGYATSYNGCQNVELRNGETRTCTISNSDIPAQLVVTKVCDPTSDTGKFNLQIDSITRLVDAGCGGTTGVVYTNAGTHAVGETAGTGTTLSDYVTAIGGACTPGGSITLGLGQSATCTITNTRKAAVTVVTTVGNPTTGQSAPPSGSQAFTFQLRQGSSSSQPGTILETQILSAANLGTVTFSTPLTPGSTYAVCEVVMPGWMTTLGPRSYTVPGSSVVCYDFTVNAGQVVHLAVNNIPASAHLTRTIGFWKNWSSVKGGSQAPKLDQALAASEPAGISIGNLVLHGSTSSPNAAPDAAKAVNILNKSTIEGRKKMASDPAFNMAAQFLAARLNVQAGAGACPAAVSAINAAQNLLTAVAFNGLTHATMSAAQASQAQGLATTLDRYNNDNTLLCSAR